VAPWAGASSAAKTSRHQRCTADRMSAAGSPRRPAGQPLASSRSGQLNRSATLATSARDPQACVPAASFPERQPVAQETWPRRRRRSSRSSIGLGYRRGARPPCSCRMRMLVTATPLVNGNSLWPKWLTNLYAEKHFDIKDLDCACRFCQQLTALSTGSEMAAQGRLPFPPSGGAPFFGRARIGTVLARSKSRVARQVTTSKSRLVAGAPAFSNPKGLARLVRRL
jgi:hypothetical protein